MLSLLENSLRNEAGPDGSLRGFEGTADNSREGPQEGILASGTLGSYI